MLHLAGFVAHAGIHTGDCLCHKTSADTDARETTIPILYLVIVYPGRRIESLSGVNNAISTHHARHQTGPWIKKNGDLASIYPLASIDGIFEKVLHVRKVLRSPPVMSPAYPPRAAGYVERQAVFCTTVVIIITGVSSCSLSTATTDLAPLLSALDGLLDLVLGLADSLGDSLVVVLLAAAPHHDAGDLDDADDAEEEVDGGEQVVLGLDDEAPARPDEARGRQGAVLLQGELLGRATEVGDAGEDEGPLSNWKKRQRKAEGIGARRHLSVCLRAENVPS